MHLIVDSDSLLYRAGFVVNEPGQEGLACHQLDTIIRGLLEKTKPDSYTFYITGGKNYRYNIYPEYKGNRTEMVRPIHLQTLKTHIMNEWPTVCTDGIEADDACGIAVYSAEDEVLLAHIDKDLNMLAGQHYNYNKDEYYTVSNEEAIRHFYYQLIMGDKADNIPGFDGKMRPKVPKFLQDKVDMLDAMSPEEMLLHVSDMWGCNDVDGPIQKRWLEFNQAATSLWLLRKEEELWHDHLDSNTLASLGLPVELIRSLPEPFK